MRNADVSGDGVVFWIGGGWREVVGAWLVVDLSARRFSRALDWLMLLICESLEWSLECWAWSSMILKDV